MNSRHVPEPTVTTMILDQVPKLSDLDLLQIMMVIEEEIQYRKLGDEDEAD